MPLVRAGLYAPHDRRKPPKVLFDRTPASILGRGAALDDESRRGGPNQRRLPQGALEPACTLREGHSSREGGIIVRSDVLQRDRWDIVGPSPL
jgi:hypothetical protein